MCSDLDNELPKSQDVSSVKVNKLMTFRERCRRDKVRRNEVGIPSSDGRRGDILSGVDDVTEALPFDEEGVERLELLIGLEFELEVEEL